MRLIDLLSASEDGPLTDTSHTWRQFINDHRDVIRERSLREGFCRRPSVDLMAQVRHNLRRYLIDTVNVNPNCDWIVLLINDEFTSNIDFDGQPAIFIPVPEHITSMYHTYRSTQRAQL